MKHYYALDGRLVVCLNAATQTAAMTRGYRPVECIMVSGLSQLNDLDAEHARATAAAAGGGTRRPPPPPQSGAAPSCPAAVPAGRDGAVPGSASAAPRVTPANPAPMPCRAEAAASASAPNAQPTGLPQQPNTAGGDATQQLPIPDAEFVVERAKLLGDPGKVGSAQFQTFQSKLRACVEVEVLIDDTTKFGPILSWKGVKTYKSKPFRTEALQIHTFLCMCSRLPAANDARLEGEQSYTWSELRNRARAYGQQNKIVDWAVALRTCINERSSGGAQGAPASEQPPTAA